MMSAGKRTRTFVTEEEDSGFKFRRTSKGGRPASASAPRTESAGRAQSTDLQAPGAPPPIVGRRSSVFGDTRRSSCFGGAPAVRQRPQGVPSAELHKHLLPDLPGPLKMRQLVAWAAQTAGGQCAAAILDALSSQTLNVSWYSRPADDQRAVQPVLGPKNQELLDAIELYERHNERLRSEERVWNAFHSETSMGVCSISAKCDAPVAAADECDLVPAAHSAEGELEAISEWIRALPSAIDGLQWTLAVIGSFEGHSRVFCERVLSQLRARMFRAETPGSSSLALLRALAASSRAS